MALFLVGKSECPLCSEVIASAGQARVFPAFIEDRNHPLWQFSDSAIHVQCFMQWPHRAAFVQAHNDYFALHYRGSRVMGPDGIIQNAPFTSEPA